MKKNMEIFNLHNQVYKRIDEFILNESPKKRLFKIGLIRNTFEYEFISRIVKQMNDVVILTDNKTISEHVLRRLNIDNIKYTPLISDYSTALLTQEEFNKTKLCVVTKTFIKNLDIKYKNLIILTEDDYEKKYDIRDDDGKTIFINSEPFSSNYLEYNSDHDINLKLYDYSTSLNISYFNIDDIDNSNDEQYNLFTKNTLLFSEKERPSNHVIKFIENERDYDENMNNILVLNHRSPTKKTSFATKLFKDILLTKQFEQVVIECELNSEYLYEIITTCFCLNKITKFIFIIDCDYKYSSYSDLLKTCLDNQSKKLFINCSILNNFLKLNNIITIPKSINSEEYNNTVYLNNYINQTELKPIMVFDTKNIPSLHDVNISTAIEIFSRENSYINSLKKLTKKYKFLEKLIELKLGPNWKLPYRDQLCTICRSIKSNTETFKEYYDALSENDKLQFDFFAS